eukprot:TRINITY_DN2427_c1_g1_i5.p2 TRINITY_DN2427_c1_g1~~TRINITY_DN2427_c1_g1_i5.p2  ORF type:complete len:365 (-),score=120.90 TRINITY_DN2427_c1_g1_i5:1852-2946(-)
MERKRKWDEAPPPPSNSQSNASNINNNNSDSTLSAVQLAAKRLSQMAPPAKSDDCEKEFDINDLKQPMRLYLCKGATQAVITQQTGAVIRVKGSYIQPTSESNLSSTGEKGLHLLISGNTPAEVDAAIEKIKEIIDKDSNRKNPFDVPVYGNYIAHTIPVNLDPLNGFNVIGKLLGPSGAFVKHIQQNSSAKVQLRGKGSRYDEAGSKDSEEPLSFLISASNQIQVDSATKLIEDLLATVRKEYNQFAQNKPQQRYVPPVNSSFSQSSPPQLYPAPPRQQQSYPNVPAAIPPQNYPTPTSSTPSQQQYASYPGYSYPSAESPYQYSQAQYNQYAYYNYPGYSYPSAENAEVTNNNLKIYEVIDV